jgi:Flp pilus assembly protein TadD
MAGVGLGRGAANPLDEARVAFKQRRLQQAHALCGAVLAGDPAHAEALFLMGRTLQEARNAAGAVELLSRAAALNPAALEPLIYLSRALDEAGRSSEAHRVAIRAANGLEHSPAEAASALALDTLGVVLDRVGEHSRAVEAARRATAAEPGQAAFWRNLGWFELHQNGVNAARTAFQRAMALDPNDHAAPSALAGIEPQTAEANLIRTLERLFTASSDPDRRLMLGHALAKSFEDLKQPKLAFEWLLRAKAAKAKAVAYNIGRDRDLFSAAASAPRSSHVSRQRAAPIFVIGLPRSGTTLLDRVITSHPDITSIGEPMTMAQALTQALSPKGGPRVEPAMLERAAGLDMQALGAAYLERTQPLARGAVRWLDKTPENYLLAGLIHQALPEARIVCLRRNPLDSILSLFRQSFSPHTDYRFTYRLEDVARYYVLFDQLITHWRGVLPADRFFEVHYENLVSHLDSEARRVLDFCGLSWTDAALRPHENAAAVDTASAAQVREPVHTGSVDRWRIYADELAPVMRILQEAGIACGGGAPKLAGYSTSTISTGRPATVTSSPTPLPRSARATGAT